MNNVNIILSIIIPIIVVPVTVSLYFKFDKWNHDRKLNKFIDSIINDK